MGEVITLDGPAASGKSTCGKLLAKKIGFAFIDTGIFYRVGALGIVNSGGPFEDNQKNVQEFEKALQSVRFVWDLESPKVFLAGSDLTPMLHTIEVNELTPKIAAIPEIREVVKQLQQEMSKSQNMIIAGRDIGTEIFPNSKLKFYITADATTRAQRRFEQFKRVGKEVLFEDVLKETQERDLKDSTREASPMRVPEDAVTIDTSKLTIEEAIEKMFDNFQRIFPNYV